MREPGIQKVPLFAGERPAKEGWADITSIEGCSAVLHIKSIG